MAWTELKERGGSESVDRMKMIVKEIKSSLTELCDMIEEMESPYGERGMMGARDGYGERDAWRIERERRGR